MSDNLTREQQEQFNRRFPRAPYWLGMSNYHSDIPSTWEENQGVRGRVVNEQAGRHHPAPIEPVHHKPQQQEGQHPRRLVRIQPDPPRPLAPAFNGPVGRADGAPVAHPNVNTHVGFGGVPQNVVPPHLAQGLPYYPPYAPAIQHVGGHAMVPYNMHPVYGAPYHAPYAPAMPPPVAAAAPNLQPLPQVAHPPARATRVAPAVVTRPSQIDVALWPKGVNEAKVTLRVATDLTFEDFRSRICARLDIPPREASLTYKYHDDPRRPARHDLRSDEDLERAMERGCGLIQRSKGRIIELEIYNKTNEKPPTTTKRKRKASPAKDMKGAHSYQAEFDELKEACKCNGHGGQYCYKNPNTSLHEPVHLFQLSIWAEAIHKGKATIRSPPASLCFDRVSKKPRPSNSGRGAPDIHVHITNALPGAGVAGPSTMPLGDQLGQRRMNVPATISQCIDLTGSSPTSENFHESKPMVCGSVHVSLSDFLVHVNAVAFASALQAVGITHAEEFFYADEWVLRHDVKLQPGTIGLMRSIAAEMTCGSEKATKSE